MSQAASQSAAFFRDVVKTQSVWTVKDDGGFPAPRASSGQRAQPFWSSRSRVSKIIASVPDYANLQPIEITLEDFCKEWLPRLESENILVGVNWSGAQAVGYDLSVSQVQQRIEFAIMS